MEIQLAWRRAVLGSVLCATGCGLGQSSEEAVEAHPEPTALSRIDSEPVGSHCAHGGMVVRRGLDEDRSGQLEEREVTSTEYHCEEAPPNPLCPGGTLDGDFTAASPNDLLRLEGCTSVTGELTVEGPNIKMLELPELRKVGGLNLEGPELESIFLPKLTSIYWHLGMADTSVAGLSFPALRTIGGAVSLGSNYRLAELAFPALESVEDGLYFGSNPALTTLTLSALASSGGDLIVRSNAKLNALELPALTTMGDRVEFTGNPSLPCSEIEDWLTRLGESGWVGETEIRDNATESCP